MTWCVKRRFTLDQVCFTGKMVCRQKGGVLCDTMVDGGRFDGDEQD